MLIFSVFKQEKTMGLDKSQNDKEKKADTKSPAKDRVRNTIIQALKQSAQEITEAFKNTSNETKEDYRQLFLLRVKLVAEQRSLSVCLLKNNRLKAAYSFFKGNRTSPKNRLASWKKHFFD